MKFTATLTLAAAFAVAACGGSEGNQLRSNPDVQAVLEDYRAMGATNAEVDELVDEIDAALDVYDTAAERVDYLHDLRESTEGMREAVKP